MDGCAPGRVADECGAGFHDEGPIHRVATSFLAAGLPDEEREAYGLSGFEPARSLRYDDGPCPVAALDEFLGSRLGNGRELAAPNLRTRVWTTPDGTWLFQPSLRVIAWVAPKGSRVDPVPQGQAWHGTPSDPPPPPPIDDTGFIVVAGKEHVERLTHTVTSAAKVWREIGTFLAAGCGLPKRETP
jgi:hypothetical protein